MQRLSTCNCFVSLSRWDRETPQLELDALLAGIYISGNVGILNVGFISINQRLVFTTASTPQKHLKAFFGTRYGYRSIVFIITSVLQTRVFLPYTCPPKMSKGGTAFVWLEQIYKCNAVKIVRYSFFCCLHWLVPNALWALAYNELQNIGKDQQSRKP